MITLIAATVRVCGAGYSGTGRSLQHAARNPRTLWSQCSPPTSQRIGLLTVLVADHDEAIAYHTEKPGFALVEDTLISATRRWVVAAPQSATEREDCCWPRLLMPNGAQTKLRTMSSLIPYEPARGCPQKLEEERSTTIPCYAPAERVSAKVVRLASRPRSCVSLYCDITGHEPSRSVKPYIRVRAGRG